ncbi:P63C domain-containing protein [Klebsiella pneumoniae]|nr:MULTISPECIES: P63C domain-containing protein [Enterobacteriaceae]MBE3289553.1 P63C domain-containing protein [Enterobacter cloacae complex sp. P31C]SXG41068.1 P63C domain [Klebsiella pneumoniae]HBQ7901374.1 P63C domain-containing protein [Klebsiella pneumoniae]HCA9675723.1 P63C domain-containing protein [Klebsiella pneumoniae]
MSELDVPSLPESPFAKHKGDLQLGGDSGLECYVLDDGKRVISLRTVVKAIASTESGNLGSYIGATGLKPFLNSDLILGETIDFALPGTQFRSRGITAEAFLDICNAYVSALRAGTLETQRQREIAIQASILLSACAKVGLIALIDEATGYQSEREGDALQLKLRAFIADELRGWEKTFPDELWEEFGRLTNWSGSFNSRPKWWGKLVLELIYDALDPDIAQHLKKNMPPPKTGQNYHQWLTQDVGLKALVSHIHQVIGIAKTCQTMRELRDKIAAYYGKQPEQLTMFNDIPDSVK